MSLNRFKEGECVLTTQNHCPCVEFIPAGNQRHGFQASQLIHYTLEPNDGGKDNGDPWQGPAQKLTLAFATADVVLLGWRLDSLADDLRDGELLAVRALPVRYANLDKNKTYVATITVTPIDKS